MTKTKTLPDVGTIITVAGLPRLDGAEPGDDHRQVEVLEHRGGRGLLVRATDGEPPFRGLIQPDQITEE